MVLGVGTFESWLGHEIDTNKISVFIKDPTEFRSLYHHVKTQQEVCYLEENLYASVLALSSST